MVERATMAQHRSRYPHPRCIYIIGAQSTGKTTLVDALRRYFDKSENRTWHGYPIPRPSIIKEVARDVLREHNYTANDITSSKTRALSLQRLILEAQLTAERTIESNWFVSDRSGLDPLVYAKWYVGGDAARGLTESAEWTELKQHMRQSLVVLCEAGAYWLCDDGVRLMPENKDEWMGFHDTFRAFLDEMSVGYEVLPHSTAELKDRVEFVIRSWENDSRTT
jgi:predicted ATPase